MVPGNGFKRSGFNPPDFEPARLSFHHIGTELILMTTVDCGISAVLRRGVCCWIVVLIESV
jgi:hypothetical protein